MRVVAGRAALPLLLLAACSSPGEAGDAASVAAGEALFVAGKIGNDVRKLDLADGGELARAASCANPHELAVAPDGRHVALACYGGQTVDLFRTSDLGRVASIDLGTGARPHGIVWHRDGAIFATAEGRKSLFRIADPLGKPVLREFPTGQDGSHMVVVAPDARLAWTANMGSGSVTRIDLAGEEPPLSRPAGKEAEGIALSPDGGTLWVSARGDDRVMGFDPVTLTVLHTLSTGRFPLRVVARPQGDFAVTSNLADGSLSVIDLAAARVVRTIAVSGADEAAKRQQVTIAFSPDGGRIYAAETGTDTIAEIDFARGIVLRRLRAGDGGDGMAILPARR